MSKHHEPLQADETATTEPARALAMLARSEIVRSKTNPRTHFDQAYIKELATSIREHGILQPILVRPLPGDRLQETFEDTPAGAPRPTHEIVCGECRWRACELADVTELPVLIRHLTDLQVLQVQLVENLKRKDLHPLEEAEGFDRLMTEHHLSVEDIAAKVDKSVSQIYVTLKLLDLTPECREELYAGKLTRSTALLVARAPQYLQAKIAKDIMAPAHGGDAMSYREAQRLIQTRYMLQLANAVFSIKDASLVPTAGSCTTCAKNTGANADMFEDVKDGDTCTDPKCFDSKRVAHFEQVASAAKAKGQQVIQGKEAMELMPHVGLTPTGYYPLDRKDYINGRYTSLRQIAGKNVPTPTMILDPYTQEVIEVLPIAIANTLIKQARGVKAPTSSASKTVAERELAAQYEDAWQDRAIEQIHANVMAGKAKGITAGLVRRLAMCALLGATLDADKRFARLFGVPDSTIGLSSANRDFLKACPDSLVGPALLVLMAEEDPEALAEIAADSQVDLQAIQDAVKADMRAQAEEKVKEKASAKAAKAGPATAKPRSKKTTKAEAQDAISKAMQDASPPPAPKFAFGDPVRFKADLKGPTGKARKVSGRKGHIDRIQDDVDPPTYGVRYGMRPSDYANARLDEIELVTPVAAWPFPTKAGAQRGGA